ncbi:hypothetical protein JEP92_09145 [Serratia surfactantfaciens]|uniref:3-hydroxyacyl-CoA dehydrogenase NAD-binding domain-containing protein n=1 Tax=Serratia surfactantfaciens TaxID=2741499 RepID=UPI0018E4CC3F|nr:3-hydroxyacyl-CoA dehydrogenase NAD-binding domain-containing protein [Serratia surfactantfaciens]MBI6152225.1 hypothetical protein [Serratia surfactantfaciens]
MTQKKETLDLVGKKVTVIGGGVIGASWAALFLSKGMLVTVSDPMEGIEEKVKSYVLHALPELSKMGVNTTHITEKELDQHLHFEKDIGKAVKYADFIQENAPEREEFKADLWELVEVNAPSNALFLSSSSGITATKQSVKMERPERLLIGHPFNPPHIMPLVEIVPGRSQEEKIIKQAVAFYENLGKVSVLIKKEISGFVANRLQAAIFRECIYLVKEGIVNVNELDNIVTSSLGIRWATSGPFLSFHLGGGSGGFQHFLEQLSPGMVMSWNQQLQEHVAYDEETNKILLKQISDSYGGSQQIDALNEQRDVNEIAVINALTGQ